MSIIVHGTKQKEETLGLIAKAWEQAQKGESITIIQPNNQGGKSLEKTLITHFPDADTESRDKARVIMLIKTEAAPPVLAEWVAHTQLRLIPETGFYSLPGLFSWDRIDIGSSVLIDHVTGLKGIGADFGCGYGFLSRHILQNYPQVDRLYGLDKDLRAVEACRMNCPDDRVQVMQADCTKPIQGLPDPLDFIVMNPPFHDGRGEDRHLGQAFLQTAAKHLKKGGVCWIVANTHLPYESVLKEYFQAFEEIAKVKGFKILQAIR